MNMQHIVTRGVFVHEYAVQFNTEGFLFINMQYFVTQRVFFLFINMQYVVTQRVFCS